MPETWLREGRARPKEKGRKVFPAVGSPATLEGINAAYREDRLSGERDKERGPVGAPWRSQVPAGEINARLGEALRWTLEQGEVASPGFDGRAGPCCSQHTQWLCSSHLN